MEWLEIGVQWNGSLMGGEILLERWGEWRWYAGSGELTRVGGVVSQILCGDHNLLLICCSGSCAWFLGRRWG